MVESGADTSGGRAFLLLMTQQQARAQAFERRMRDIRLHRRLRETDEGDAGARPGQTVDLREPPEAVTPTAALPEPRQEQ